MSEELKKFMVRLASDVNLLSEFIADPKKTLEGSGLAEEDREVLTSGDQNRLYAAVAPQQVAITTQLNVSDAATHATGTTPPTDPGAAAARPALVSPLIEPAASGTTMNAPVTYPVDPGAAASAAAQALGLQWPGAIVYVYPHPLNLTGYQGYAGATPQMYPTYASSQMAAMMATYYAQQPQQPAQQAAPIQSAPTQQASDAPAKHPSAPSHKGKKTEAAGGGAAQASPAAGGGASASGEAGAGGGPASQEAAGKSGEAGKTSEAGKSKKPGKGKY